MRSNSAPIHVAINTKAKFRSAGYKATRVEVVISGVPVSTIKGNRGSTSWVNPTCLASSAIDCQICRSENSSSEPCAPSPAESASANNVITMAGNPASKTPWVEFDNPLCPASKNPEISRKLSSAAFPQALIAATTERATPTVRLPMSITTMRGDTLRAIRVSSLTRNNSAAALQGLPFSEMRLTLIGCHFSNCDSGPDAKSEHECHSQK